MNKELYRKLAVLAGPIIIQNIITFSVSLADNIMVGSLGEIALDGVYVANQITTILNRLVTGLATSMTVLATQYWGKKDVKSVKTIIGIGLKIGLVSALLMYLALFIFPSQILGLFTDKPDVLNAAVGYARIISFTYIMYCIANMLIAAMRCVETVRIGMIVSLCALITNISLNALLIPRFGLSGAAYATLAARSIEMLIMIVYVTANKRFKLKINELMESDAQLLKDFIKYGLPITLGSVTWGINLAVQGAIVGRLSSDAIAAVSISNTFFNLITVGIYGLASASGIIIGKTVGSGDIPLVKQYTKSLQKVFLINGFITGFLMFITRDLILMLYSYMSPETLELASQFIIVLSVMSVGTSYQMSTLTGIVRPGGATNFVLINDLLFVWIIVLPSSWLAAFVFNAAPWIVVMCLKCDQILKCIVAVVKVNRFDWIKDLTRAH